MLHKLGCEDANDMIYILPSELDDIKSNLKVVQCRKLDTLLESLKRATHPYTNKTVDDLKVDFTDGIERMPSPVYSEDKSSDDENIVGQTYVPKIQVKNKGQITIYSEKGKLRGAIVDAESSEKRIVAESALLKLISLLYTGMACPSKSIHEVYYTKGKKLSWAPNGSAYNLTYTKTIWESH